MKGKQGFTLLELLIVLGILGIILGIAVLSGRQILNGQEERAALHSFRQAVTRAATGANSRNTFITLRIEDNSIIIRDTETLRDIQSYPIPRSVQITDTSGNTLEGRFLAFGPSGKVSDQILTADNLKFRFQANDTTYTAEVSLIGEVRIDSP